jgi:hypothetical protein
MFYVRTKYHLPKKTHKLVMAIKTKAVEMFRIDAIVVFYILDRGP